MTFKFAHGRPVAVVYAMVFAKKIFSKRKYFISNLQTCKYTFSLEVCKFEKNTSGWNAAGYLA